MNLRDDNILRTLAERVHEIRDDIGRRLAFGNGIENQEQYRELVGQVKAFQRVLELIPEIESELQKPEGNK